MVGRTVAVGAFGPVLMGASSKSGSIRRGAAGVGSTGMVLVATSPFGGVIVGSSGARCFDTVT